MKKIFVLLALMMPFALSAQEYRHEISIAYGLGSHSNVTDLYRTGADNSKPKDIVDVQSLLGPVSLEYFNRVSEFFSLGLTGVYTNLECDFKDQNATSYHVRGRHFTVMPGVKLHWLRTSGFNMYSKASAGASYNIDRENQKSFSFNFQLSPVGVEFGTHFCVFAEAGYGEQGIILAGLRAKF